MKTKEEYVSENREILLKKAVVAFCCDIISSEKDVIYIMSLLRKLLDYNVERLKKYSLLKFFCNWCLHTELSWASNESKFFLEEIENEWEKSKEVRQKKKLLQIGQEEKKRFYSIMISRKFQFLHELRNQIQELLIKEIDNEKWFVFRKELFNVILSCPYKPIKKIAPQ